MHISFLFMKLFQLFVVHFKRNLIIALITDTAPAKVLGIQCEQLLFIMNSAECTSKQYVQLLSNFTHCNVLLFMHQNVYELHYTLCICDLTKQHHEPVFCHLHTACTNSKCLSMHFHWPVLNFCMRKAFLVEKVHLTPDIHIGPCFQKAGHCGTVAKSALVVACGC